PCSAPPRALHSFPTRRSSDLIPVNPCYGSRESLFRWGKSPVEAPRRLGDKLERRLALLIRDFGADVLRGDRMNDAIEMSGCSGRDRKSTRLNSSHVKISYAVF